MLWDPAAHEPLVEDAWDEERARAAIRAIAADAEDAFADGWPAHPEDVEPDDAGPWHGLYLGGAGVVDALRRLAARGYVERSRDYLPYLERLRGDVEGASLMLGETGVLLVRHRHSPSEHTLGRLRELIAGNVDDEHRELFMGSPGTMLAARELGLEDLWRASADRLVETRDGETGLWTEYLGPAHGFAGCVLALGTLDDAAAVARRHAVVEDGLANWPPLADGVLVRNDTVRVQWCHGAPGMVVSLGELLDEELALAGGELTWRAGPPAKGAGLCHGTAGNGYALLALFERTGNELWLERGRRFAAHAIAQVEQARRLRGVGRYSLWTGDLGTALYLADCVDGGGTLPLP